MLKSWNPLSEYRHFWQLNELGILETYFCTFVQKDCGDTDRP